MDRNPYSMNPPLRIPGRKLPRTYYVVAGIVLFLLVAGGRLLDKWVDWLWYGEVGYRQVFVTTLATRWELGLAFGFVFLAVALLNLGIARKLSPPPSIPRDLRGQVEMAARKSLGPILYGGAAVLAGLSGVTAADQWREYLLFKNATPFHIVDPLFQQDIGYYVFRLPFLGFVVGFLFWALLLTMIAVAATYIVDRAAEFSARLPRLAPISVAHLSVLGALLMLVKAVDYWLQRYDLLYSTDGVVTGASYADVHARLPVLIFLTGLCVFGALAWLIQIPTRKLVLGPAVVLLIALCSIIGGEVYPGIVQSVHVKPNEFSAEAPYLRSNIDFTRHAYGLDDVAVSDFPIKQDYSRGLVQRNAATINNARLWDYTIAAQAYSQLQEIKPYYQFVDVDVDRYTLNSKYRQTLISVREMNQEGLPDTAKTWQAQRLVYTHGYGFVMSPVNEVSNDGQPNFLVRDFPPATSTDLKIDQSRIYFGEAPQDWVIVGGADEFDYPGPKGDVFHRYQGKAGIPIGSALRRMLFALNLGDTNVYLSGQVTADSRLLLHRTVKDRIQAVAPFLTLDSDAYPVIADGRVVWMQDAYTTTDRYPYSEPTDDNTGVNYIRNSVKATVDAYDGTVTLYIADPTDPIIQSYSRAFPTLFHPMSELPASLRTHIRYGEDMFNIQSQKYLNYHMTDTRQFYTKEDSWSLPTETRGAIGQSDGSSMAAFYVIMKLPHEHKQEMVLIRPFTPRGKNNMEGWMAARCDPAGYGQRVVYRFPIDNLPEGPSLIDSKIQQKPDISKEITLLNSNGSQVVLGNMLTIPVENSILYVQPLYVQAENSGNRRAELTRVIVAYGDRLEMASTLGEALDRVFGGGGSDIEADTGPSTAASTTSGSPGGTSTKALIDQASSAWNRAQTAQRAGDWAGYGKALKDVDTALRDLKRRNP